VRAKQTEKEREADTSDNESKKKKFQKGKKKRGNEGIPQSLSFYKVIAHNYPVFISSCDKKYLNLLNLC
jgi:hypothetical protein